MYRCLMEWHYGTSGPVWHVGNTSGRYAWHGYHGAGTDNESRICDECADEWRDNYGTRPLPIGPDELARIAAEVDEPLMMGS